ncbi:MAG: IclR family transcriptional regulator [Candidatus Nanopelagicales bacterium]|jgi:DNA-binding IclR family transcriptional regulator
MADKPQESASRSVSIAVAVLECFLSTEELGASEVARRIGVAKSTAHRALGALAEGGLLDRIPSGRYRLGLRLYDYGQLAIDRLLLRELALPILASLRDQISETVQLGIPAGHEVLYVDRLEGTHGLRFHSDSYRRVLAHSSSSGKVIAAFSSAAHDAIVRYGLVRLTPHTVVHPAKFEAQLDLVRRQGFIMSTEETEVGLSSVAAPVFLDGADGRRIAVAAISIAGPTQRIAPMLKHLAPRVVEGARILTQQLARRGGDQIVAAPDSVVTPLRRSGTSGGPAL